MSTYNGIFLRSALDQRNTLPRAGKQDQSPDIIPRGIEPLADPQSYLADRYTTDRGKPLLAQQVNYIYLRGKNYADKTIGDTGATAPRLFWTKASSLFLPKTWTELSTCPNNAALELNAGAGLVGSVNQPFIWQPENIEQDRYCLIAVVPSPGYKNSIPFWSIDPFDEWVAANGGIAWREVSVVNASTLTISSKLQFGLTSGGGQMTFVVNGTNLPKGCKVSFSAGTPGTNPALYLAPTEVKTYPSFSAKVTCEVPANYKTGFYISIVTPAHTVIPSDAFIQVTVMPGDGAHSNSGEALTAIDAPPVVEWQEL